MWSKLRNNLKLLLIKVSIMVVGIVQRKVDFTLKAYKLGNRGFKRFRFLIFIIIFKIVVQIISFTG